MRCVDRLHRRGYVRAALAVTYTAALLGGCTGSARPAQPGPIDPTLEPAAVSSTQLRSRLRVVFEWSLQDRDARFTGDGVARVEPPYRARLDLFGPRGEGYLSAALVDFELRLPPGATAELLPPPPLLWSVLGVFRAPPNAELVDASGDSVRSELQYRAGEETWRFLLQNGRLQRVEWQGPGQGRQTVELQQYDARGLPKRAVYRDLREFRELSLELTQAYEVDSFPPEIWQPGVR